MSSICRSGAGGDVIQDDLGLIMVTQQNAYFGHQILVLQKHQILVLQALLLNYKMIDIGSYYTMIVGHFHQQKKTFVVSKSTHFLVEIQREVFMGK